MTLDKDICNACGVTVTYGDDGKGGGFVAPR